ncbi:MAG: hypothetical protein JNL98_21715 [Bryobacterales bacterium]|nr:hypothetical protein [Bryobacterales bacterium]
MGEKCIEILGWKDAFESGELTSGQRETVMVHLQACAACAREYEAVRKLRTRLKSAVAAASVPVGLETRIRARIGEQDRKTLSLPLPRLAFAALGVMVLAAGTWTLALRPMRAQIASVLSIGTGDHVHCSIERKNPPQGTFFRNMQADFPGLEASVKDAMPKDFRLLESHDCRHEGRRFGHLVYEKQGRKVSVIVTRKQEGEHLPRTALLAKIRAHGIPVFHIAGDRSLEALGFETARHLVFVVSDLDERQNLAVMAAVGPVLTEVVR